MKMTKKRVGLGVAIVIALGVLGWVFKPAPAEAADVSVYGNLNYMVSNNDDASGNATAKAENNGSAIGVNITEDLAEGVTGFGKLELAVDTDDTGSTPFDSKLAYAGIDMGDVGTLSAGRQNSVFKGAVTSKTDVFPEYGGKAAQKLFSRDSHTVIYSNQIGPIAFDNLVKVDGATGKSGVDVYETSASMSLDETIDLGVAYSDDKVNDVKYYGAGITVAAGDNTSIGYNHTIKDNEVSNVETKANEITGSHTIDSTTFAIGYGKIEDGNAYTTIGAKQKVSDKLELYGAYEMADVSSGTDTNGMSFGLKLKF